MSARSYCVNSVALCYQGGPGWLFGIEGMQSLGKGNLSLQKALFGPSFCCVVAKPCITLCDPVDCSMPGFPVLLHLWILLKLISIELVMPSNHLSLCCPLLLLSIFPSIRVFFKESVLCIWWPKYWSFSFSIGPSNDYSGLISFRIGWFDLLAVQGTLKSLLQHHSSKTSIVQHSAFFLLQFTSMAGTILHHF